MDIDLKADAEKWGQDWLDRLKAAYSDHGDWNA